MRRFWKKTAVWVTIVGMLLTGCGKKETEPDPEIDVADVIDETGQPDTEAPAEELPPVEMLSDLEAEITWWTYPVFVQDEGAEAGAYERALADRFSQYYPNIKVNVEVLDYESGPARVEEAIANNALPDILFDEPGRISGYARKGVLSDLSGLFTEERKNDLASPGVLSACEMGESYYMYPLSMVNYVMAFNKGMLETTGAIDLLDREGARTWDTDTFAQVLERLNNSGFRAGAVFCSGVGGDYATRAFLTNLYDAPLMNEDMSAYAFQGDVAANTLGKVKEWVDAGWLLNGSGETGAGSVEDFVNGETSFTLLWSLPQAISNSAALAEKGIEVVEMPYPSQDGAPSLEYFINGFCAFKTEEESRKQAAEYFIDFVCNGPEAAEHIVRTGAFPVRKSLGDVYQGNEQALFYEALTPYSGPYYGKSQGFETMRVYWYRMISQVLNGETAAGDASDTFVENANEALKGQ